MSQATTPHVVALSPTKSSHKRKGCKNVEANKHKCKDKKVATKACKAHHKEAKEDELLVECKGETSQVSELHILTLQLKSDNQLMRAQLMHAKQPEPTKSLRVIPEPDNLSIVDVKLTCPDKENDVNWCWFWFPQPIQVDGWI